MTDKTHSRSRGDARRVRQMTPIQKRRRKKRRRRSVKSDAKLITVKAPPTSELAAGRGQLHPTLGPPGHCQGKTAVPSRPRPLWPLPACETFGICRPSPLDNWTLRLACIGWSTATDRPSEYEWRNRVIRSKTATERGRESACGHVMPAARKKQK